MADLKMQYIHRREIMDSYQKDDKKYAELLRIYKRELERMIQILPKLLEEKDYRLFITTVHGIKSASRNVGALHFSEMSENMEKWGKSCAYKELEKNLMQYLNMAGAVLKESEIYVDMLREEKADGGSGKPWRETLDSEILEDIKTAARNMDMLQLEENMDNLKGYEYPPKIKAQLESLQQLVDDFEYEKIIKKVEFF